MSESSSSQVDQQAQLSRDVTKNAVEAGKLYTGVIVEVRPDQTMTVQLEGMETPVEAVWAVGVFCQMLGIQQRHYPWKGTGVKVALGNPSFIVATIPSHDFLSARHTSVTGDEHFREESKIDEVAGIADNSSIGPGVPGDMLMGETDMTNVLGVGIQMLTTFAKLTAGDRAKVEVCLLNEMVRIVSDTYKHHSAFGDMEIYNDGGLNVRWDGTSHPHELWGLLDKSGVKAKADLQNKVDMTSIDAINDTGRWRFSMFMGWLGNFVSMWVTDPTTELGKIAATATRAGRFRQTIAADGSMLMQSVSDIAFERVVRVVVPIELKRHEDPTGVSASKLDTLDKGMLKLWDAPPQATAFETAFQLREYSRYLTQFMSMARFHQKAAAGVWKVPSEADSPAPSPTNGEADVAAANGNIVMYESFATIRIMRDGSIVNWDGYGNCVHMGGAGVKVSSVTHLDLEAAGDVNIRAGQNVNVFARRNVEVIAYKGGIKARCKAFLQMLCEKGTILFRSEAEDPAQAAAPAADDTTQDPGIIVNDAAILLDAPNGRITSDSQRQFMVRVKGPADTDGDTDRTASIVLQSDTQHVDIRSGKDTIIKSARRILLSATQKMLLKAPAGWLNFAAQTLFGNNQMLLKGGKLKVPIINSLAIQVKGSIQGPKRPGPTYKGPPHFNHIDRGGEGADVTINEASSFAAEDHLVSASPQRQSPYPVTQEFKWVFDTAAQYSSDTHYQSLAQQWLDNPSPDNTKHYDVLSWSDIKSYPGRSAAFQVNVGRGDPLWKKTAVTGRALLSAKQDLAKRTFYFHYLKR